MYIVFHWIWTVANITRKLTQYILYIYIFLFVYFNLMWRKATAHKCIEQVTRGPKIVFMYVCHSCMQESPGVIFNIFYFLCFDMVKCIYYYAKCWTVSGVEMEKSSKWMNSFPSLLTCEGVYFSRAVFHVCWCILFIWVVT